MQTLLAAIAAAWATLAAIDYNQSILAFIALLAMVVPQIFIYLNSKKAADNSQVAAEATKKIETAVNGTKKVLEDKIIALDAKVLQLTGDKAAAEATAEEKSRAQEIKVGVAEAKKEQP